MHMAPFKLYRPSMQMAGDTGRTVVKWNWQGAASVACNAAGMDLPRGWKHDCCLLLGYGDLTTGQTDMQTIGM